MTPVRRLGLLINPASRRHRREPHLAATLRRQMVGRGPVEVSADLGELRGIAERFQEAGVNVVALSGGDGTTSHALTAFRQTYGEASLPTLALLRGGTMNTVANGIGVAKGHPKELLARFLEASAARGGWQEKEMATLDLNGQVGFITGVGVIPSFLEEYYQRGQGSPSPWTALTTLSGAVLSSLIAGKLARQIADPIRCRVSVDGVAWPEADYLTIGAATVPQLGLGFTPFYRCREDLDRFQIIGFRGTKLQFIQNMPRLLKGRATTSRVTHEALATEARVTQLPGPTLYTIDGEVLSAETLHIRPGPRVQVFMG